MKKKFIPQKAIMHALKHGIHEAKENSLKEIKEHRNKRYKEDKLL